MSVEPSWLTRLDTCPSTNTWALAHLGRLAPGQVVIADRQTAGRGRDGRSWLAPAGSLAMTCIVDADGLPPGAIALIAGLACHHAVADACPQVAQQLTIKWPNDVLLDYRKLAGVLCEGDGRRYAVGIGLNRDAELPPGLDAASLRSHSPPAELPLVAAIRGYLLEGIGLAAARGLEPLLPALRACDALLGRSVTVATRQGALHGTAAGIDGQGRLLVVVPGGGIAEVDAGHITAW